MQNKHQNFFLSCWCPNVRGGGGGQAGWDKIPSLPKKKFGRLPLITEMTGDSLASAAEN